jgi:YD repeat-containing protein
MSPTAGVAHTQPDGCGEWQFIVLLLAQFGHGYQPNTLAHRAGKLQGKRKQFDEAAASVHPGLTRTSRCSPYDAVGNRLVQNATGSLTTYAYDAANQLKTSKAAGGTTTYTCDSNGNQQVARESGGNRTTYTWDSENQNALVRLPDGSRATMSYNADFRRTRKDPQ